MWLLEIISESNGLLAFHKLVLNINVIVIVNMMLSWPYRMDRNMRLSGLTKAHLTGSEL